MTLPDKHHVRDALVQRLSAVAERMASVARSTREGATHAEAKPENDKDTRALEQSYLARGQALRVEELREQIQVLRFMPLRAYADSDPLGAGALVRLEFDAGARCVFLAPHGGGLELTVGGAEVLVVTPQSPLGALLLGRTLGDDLVLRVRGGQLEYVIAAVA